MDKTCRTCLRKVDTLLPLFVDQLHEKIEIITSVQVLKTDNLPKEICAECVINVNLAYNFRRVVINSDRELKLRMKLLHEMDILDRNKNEVSLIKIKSELESSTDEDFMMENVCDIVENTEDKPVEPKKEIEVPCQIQINNITQQQQRNDLKLNVPLIQGATRKYCVYKCPTCDFITPYSKKYNDHKRIHSVASRSVCNICGKTVRTDNLRKHISIHTEPPVACKICGKFSKNTESMRSHVLTHKGLVITCEYCGQIFKFRGGYKRHVTKQHTIGADKKAKCHLCDKRFHDTTDLKKHIRTHTGERPYKCEYCQKGFSSGYALKTHIRQHTNERPYKCDHCPMAFPQKVSLRTHLKSKHSILLDSAS